MRKPHWWAILIPLSILIIIQTWLVFTFGNDALSGASQVGLLLVSAVVCTIARLFYHTPWENIWNSINKGIGEIGTVFLLLLMIGMLSGTWMVSGVVPTMICYGLKIMSPKIFLATACIVSALVALMTGSSWTTIATIGVAMIGIGTAMGYPVGLTAGAIISGAYFGDKMSPLSDTTVLASSSAGTDLFTHIRYMLITTIPSITIALVLYLVLSLYYGSSDSINVELYDTTLRNTFTISPWLLLVPLFAGILIALRLPAIPTLMISALMGAVVAPVAQPQILWHIATGNPLSEFVSATPQKLMTGTWTTFFGTTHIDTGIEAVNSLVQTRGMNGMLMTVFLVLAAASFGATLVGTGMLQAFTDHLMTRLRRRASIVGSTVGVGILCDLLTGDQFLSILMTCNMFRGVYQKKGYESRLLSRSVEDSATVTSVLIPWNSCGMTQSMVLGVATLAYLPWCFFNILSPVSSIIVALTGYKIRHEK